MADVSLRVKGEPSTHGTIEKCQPFPDHATLEPLTFLMTENYKVSAYLSYNQRSSSRPCVNIDFALRGILSTTQLAEAVCISIAQNQPSNSLGLFRHPLEVLETGLFFKSTSENYQNQITDLIWFMYEACNNPMCVTVEIDGIDTLSDPLNELIKAFYRPFDKSGLIDDERGDPKWTWNCRVTPQTSLSVLARFANASDYGRLIFPPSQNNAAQLKTFREANITWPVETSSG